jgi:multiple antibiotic resistance protein
MSFEFAITVFAAIFAIVNPIGNIPVFVAITQDYSPEQKMRVIRKVCIVAASVLLAFGIFGNYIFAIYGITIPAFKIAGGLLLFSIAFNMTRGQVSKTKMTGEEHEEALEKEEVGVVPLGIPLFAGPGAITTVMIYISLATTSNDVVFDLSSIFISILITIIASYILLKYAEPIFSKMGKSGAGAFTRIMGLLLAAIAIEFILTGTFTAIDTWYHIVP